MGVKKDGLGGTGGQHLPVHRFGRARRAGVEQAGLDASLFQHRLDERRIAFDIHLVRRVVGDGQKLEVFAQDRVLVGAAELAHLLDGRLRENIQGGEREKDGVKKFHGASVWCVGSVWGHCPYNFTKRGGDAG